MTIGGTTHNGFTAVQNYTYDSLNRLDDAAEYFDANQTPSWRQDFSYDRYGNRNFVEGNTSFEGFDKLCANNTELCADLRKVLNPSANASDNRLSSSDGYVFDPSGNTIRDPQSRRFTYDGENKQVKVETLDLNGNPVSTVGEYVYDGDGRRIKKHVPSTGEVTVFVYDAAGKLIGEYSTILETQSRKVSYTTADHLGSPRILTDQNGSVISRRDFMPYGEETTTPERYAAQGYTGDDVRQRFTTYERDNESELDFAQARYYNPAHGRFTAVDPLLASGEPGNPQTWDRYIYVGNNPLVMIDPTGEMGDYYDRDNGSYLGNDGIDDHKVYSGKEVSRTEKDGKIYRQVGNVKDLGITDVEFNSISNVIKAEGGTNEAQEYLWLAHTANNCLQTKCQSNPGGSLLSLLSTRYSTAPAAAKTELSPEDGSARANAARAGLINVLSGGADPTGGATFWDGTDFILRGRSHPKFNQNDSIVVREDILSSYTNSQGGQLNTV